MWTGHSDAWEDLWPSRYSSATKLRHSPSTRKTIIDDDDIIDMLEVITSMKVHAIILDEKQKTKEQIFFDEIDRIIDYIVRNEWIKSDRKAIIRHIGLKIWVHRQLIDGFFLYSWLTKGGNSIFVGNLKTKLNKIPRWLNWDRLKIYWQDNKSSFTEIINSFESFKKIVMYYQHQA